MPISTGIAIMAHPIMSLFGSEYARTAATALTVLALTYSVGVFRQFYVVISRVRNQVRRTSFYAVCIGIMELGAAWYGGSQGGLHGLVIWLAGAFAVEGLLMAPAVLTVALGRVPAGQATPASMPAIAAGADGETTTGSSTDAGAVSRTSAPESVGGGADASAETIVMARITDETAVIQRIADDTAIIQRIADETAIIPAIRDEVMVSSVAGTPAVNGASATNGVPGGNSADRAGETAIIPRVTTDETVVIRRISADETAVLPRVSNEAP